MKIKYNMDLMKFMSVFETLTRSKIKDCFEDRGGLVFVVKPGEIGKAIGKKAVNIRKLENILKKKVRVVEYNDEVSSFIANMVMPLKLENAEEDSGIVTLKASDTKTRGLLIGREAQNLRNLEKNVKRYFDIEEIKVV